MQIGNDMVRYVEREVTLKMLWTEFFGRRTLAQSLISIVVAAGIVALLSFNGLYA